MCEGISCKLQRFGIPYFFGSSVVSSESEIKIMEGLFNEQGQRIK